MKKQNDYLAFFFLVPNCKLLWEAWIFSMISLTFARKSWALLNIILATSASLLTQQRLVMWVSFRTKPAEDNSHQQGSRAQLLWSDETAPCKKRLWQASQKAGFSCEERKATPAPMPEQLFTHVASHLKPSSEHPRNRNEKIGSRQIKQSLLEKGQEMMIRSEPKPPYFPLMAIWTIPTFLLLAEALIWITKACRLARKKEVRCQPARPFWFQQ